MKKTITFVVAVAILAGLASVAKAVQPVTKPFVHVFTSPRKLDLGTSWKPGTHDVAGALTVQIDSNCLHGPLVISATRLRHTYSAGFILPQDILVRTETTDGYVAMDKPVAISKTAAGPQKVVLDLQVRTKYGDMAGTYKGTFTVTVMPPV